MKKDWIQKYADWRMRQIAKHWHFHFSRAGKAAMALACVLGLLLLLVLLPKSELTSTSGILGLCLFGFLSLITVGYWILCYMRPGMAPEENLSVDDVENNIKKRRSRILLDESVMLFLLTGIILLEIDWKDRLEVLFGVTTSIFALGWAILDMYVYRVQQSNRDGETGHENQ